jgi:hypothetical protein
VRNGSHRIRRQAPAFHRVDHRRSRTDTLVSEQRGDILLRWNALTSETQVAGVFRTCGWLLILAAIGFVAWRAWRDHRAAR